MKLKKEDWDYVVPLYETHKVFINTEDNHYKLWAYEIKLFERYYKSNVKFIWGRIGSKLRETTKELDQWELNNLIYKKRDKGYISITKEMHDEWIIGKLLD